MAENIREIVLDTLLALEREQGYSHQLIRGVLHKYDYLDIRDKSFIKRTTEGAIERRIELDYHLDHISSVPTRKMKPLIRCLLRMSAYQMLYMDTVPDSAVCNEAVKLAGKRGFRSLKGFVNGVLRNLSKQKDRLPLPDRKREPVKFLSVKYSVPVWLVELWLSEYDEEITETLLQGLSEIQPVSLRFPSGRPEAEWGNRVEKLKSAGVDIKGSPYLPYIYLVEHTDNISLLPGYDEGEFTVQDVSSALAVEAAQIKDTDFVMDVCAAPGGKSILAAEKAGRVLARDVTQAKTALISENIRRMGAENIQVQVYDATVFDEQYCGKADVVFMDVPCSGLGVMGKKRDIKYRMTPEDIKSLVGLQRRLVDNSWRYVKPGGTLIYSTCTIDSEENEAMVRYIARKLPFEPVSLEGILPAILWEQNSRLQMLKRENLGEEDEPLTAKEQAACIQLMPGYMECDGFFFARFRRKLL